MNDDMTAHRQRLSTYANPYGMPEAKLLAWLARWEGYNDRQERYQADKLSKDIRILRIALIKTVGQALDPDNLMKEARAKAEGMTDDDGEKAIKLVEAYRSKLAEHDLIHGDCDF